MVLVLPGDTWSKFTGKWNENLFNILESEDDHQTVSFAKSKQRKKQKAYLCVLAFKITNLNPA